MAEKWLIVLLRLTAVVLLTALFPAVMPFAWMDATHQWLGLGKLPDAPIVGYLTRSLSALYAVHGVLVVYLSLDVRRFLPVIGCVAWISVAFGGGMIVLDFTVGLPWLWAVGEGTCTIVFGISVIWLARIVGRETH